MLCFSYVAGPVAVTDDLLPTLTDQIWEKFPIGSLFLNCWKPKHDQST